MLKRRKDARKRLKEATLAEYCKLIKEANLTPEQRNVIKFHICGEYSVIKVADTLNCCEATVRKRLAEAYDKIAKV